MFAHCWDGRCYQTLEDSGVGVHFQVTMEIGLVVYRDSDHMAGVSTLSPYTILFQTTLYSKICLIVIAYLVITIQAHDPSRTSSLCDDS